MISFKLQKNKKNGFFQKLIFGMLLFLSFSNLSSQNIAIDSLIAELKKLDNSPQSDNKDTLKITIFLQLVENIYDDKVWPKYNDLAIELSNKLKTSNNPKIKYFALKSIVDGYINQGFLCKISGDNKNAIDKYIKSIKGAQKINYLFGEATASINLASLLSQQKQFDEALKYLQRALFISYQLNEKRIEAITIQSIASHFILKMQNDSAEVYLVKSITINEKLNNINGFLKQKPFQN